MVTSLMFAFAVGSISLVQNNSALCGSSLVVNAPGLTAIESPLKDQTIQVDPLSTSVDLGKPRTGYFTFIGSDGKGNLEAISVLLLPAGNGCFSVRTNEAKIVSAPAAPALLEKFVDGLGKLDSGALQKKWESKLAMVALENSTPVIVYCSLVASPFATAFAASCIASVAGVAVNVGFAYLHAARELMASKKLITEAESKELETALNVSSLVVGAGLSVAAGKPPAEVLKDWKALAGVLGTAVKSSDAGPNAKVAAAVGLAWTKKIIMLTQVLSKVK